LFYQITKQPYEELDSMSDIKELKAEADQLGVKYSPNIGASKLQEKIDQNYEAQETSGKALAQVVEKVEKQESEQPVASSSSKGGWNDTKRRALSKQREAAARKTKVITIIDNDQRVNNQTTTCTVNCGNASFDLGQMTLPLNMEVEVMTGHINVLTALHVLQHQKDPKTGMSTPIQRPRYTISFSQHQPA